MNREKGIRMADKYSQARPSSIKRTKISVISGPKDPIVLHSDVRKQKVSAMCKLCHETKDLMLSHIAPRWAYQWMKQEGGITAHINSKGIIAKINDGEKHYLLCGDCELLLGKKEEYLADLCKGTEANLRMLKVDLAPGPILTGIDAIALKGGILGILYKAHYAPSNPWEHVTLPDAVMNKIRSFLLNGDESAAIGLHLAANRWVSFEQVGINPKAVISIHFAPDPKMIAIQLLLGGWSWMCFLPSDEGDIEADEIPGLLGDPDSGFTLPTLNQGEPWKILQGDILECYLVNSDLIEFQTEHIPHFADMDKCYCGMTDRGFETCCMDRWIPTEVDPSGSLIFHLMP
jgi:hypothetical protein